MLTQSEKDSKEKKELKGMVVTMDAYINSLINLGVAPIIQIPQPFNPNSAESHSS
jgi:molecular chaperone GrpE (heat shock protein)